METITGRFIYEIYKKDLYGVYRFKSYDETIVVSGHFLDVKMDALYELSGSYYDHPKYGFQFKVTEVKELLPNEKNVIVQYLASDRFKGIGKKTAEVIYQHFGDECLNILKENPSLIEEVSISLKQKQAILAGFEGSDDETYQTHIYLISKGFNSFDSQLILHNYPDNTIQRIEANPYDIYYDIHVIGFKKVDEYAKSLGIDLNDPRRIIAYMVYLIQDLSFRTGNVYHFYEDLKNAYYKSVEGFDFDEALDLAIKDHKIIEDETRFYYVLEYEAECFIAEWLASLREDLNYDQGQIEYAIENLEDELSIEYDPLQKEAIHKFFENEFSLIVGGPGTGKTTIVKALVEISKQINPYQTIYIVAPTGRASKRISELCDVPSKTIHSLLLWDKESNTFTYDEKNPLQVDTLIIDEFSMVDNRLFASLLKASRFIKKICIIGDDEQLPSINCGNVLNDLIESKAFSYTKLESNFRQSSNNEIIQLASDILYDQVDFDAYHKDVVFVECEDQFGEYLMKGIDFYCENGYEFADLQVLAPMYKGGAGIDRLNVLLQAKYNPKDPYKNEYTSGIRTFREGDKMLQLKNYADDDVYNGDIGILEVIDLKEKAFVVNFDGIYVDYNYDELIDLSHAYALSVHKAQGSEYPLVFLMVSKQHQIMLNRKLIYTAISRAKQKVIIIGSKEAFLKGIKTLSLKRNTYLSQRIQAQIIQFDTFFDDLN